MRAEGRSVTMFVIAVNQIAKMSFYGPSIPTTACPPYPYPAHGGPWYAARGRAVGIANNRSRRMIGWCKVDLLALGKMAIF